MDALEFQKAQKAKLLACYGETPESIIAKAQENDLEKGGEGSKGGKIIGHTKSGKPVYADLKADHENYKHFTSADHKEAATLHNEAKQFLHPRENAGEMDKHRSASESHTEKEGEKKAWEKESAKLTKRYKKYNPEKED